MQVMHCLLNLDRVRGGQNVRMLNLRNKLSFMSFPKITRLKYLYFNEITVSKHKHNLVIFFNSKRMFFNSKITNKFLLKNILITTCITFLLKENNNHLKHGCVNYSPFLSLDFFDKREILLFSGLRSETCKNITVYFSKY